MATDVYAQIVEKIIAQQETLIGPVAIEQAKSVSGLTVDWGSKQISLSGNGSEVVNDLVEQYKKLFGQISVEVCKEAVGRLALQLTPDQVPSSLR